MMFIDISDDADVSQPVSPVKDNEKAIVSVVPKVEASSNEAALEECMSASVDESGDVTPPETANVTVKSVDSINKDVERPSAYEQTSKTGEEPSKPGSRMGTAMEKLPPNCVPAEEDAIDISISAEDRIESQGGDDDIAAKEDSSEGMDTAVEKDDDSKQRFAERRAILQEKASKAGSIKTPEDIEAENITDKALLDAKREAEKAAKAERRSMEQHVIWPTEKHFETWLKETGREAEAKEKKDKSQLEWLSDLMSNVAFRKHWKTFLDLHESGKSTKKDREAVRKQSLLAKTKEKKASLRKQIAKVLWPTDKHFETYMRETGRQERVKEKQGKQGEALMTQTQVASNNPATEDGQVCLLLSNKDFKAQWDHFSELLKTDSVTKADRQHMRKAAILCGTTKEVRKALEQKELREQKRRDYYQSMNENSTQDLRSKLGGNRNNGPQYMDQGPMGGDPMGPNNGSMGPTPWSQQGSMFGSNNAHSMYGSNDQQQMGDMGQGSMPFMSSGPSGMGGSGNRSGPIGYSEMSALQGGYGGMSGPMSSSAGPSSNIGGGGGRGKRGYEVLDLGKAASMPPQEMLRYVQKCAHSYAAELDARFPDCRKVMSKLVLTSIPDPRIDMNKPYVPCDRYNQDDSCMLGLIHMDANGNARIHACALCYFAVAGLINHHRMTQCPLLQLIN